MDESLHHCPTCGAPFRIRNRYVKVVACEFCGHIALYDGVRLDPTGRTAGLADLPSPLYLDAAGTLEGQSFRVTGRLLYSYDGGRWHEWFLQFADDRAAWLVEDEGRFTLLAKEPVHDAPPFAGVRAGEELRVGGRDVFVTEVGTAEITGAEGQLGLPVFPGERIGYVDGTAGGEEVGLEYAELETELFVGRTLAPGAVVVEPEDF
ncbi:MAG TPA: DUF4178 domain-containing protein [Rhodothermales bacterium]|nr:DUF4178 domain-containing protein [Rhodothermales bacterium]